MTTLLFLAALASADASDLDAVCTWSDARWQHAATMYLPGTATPFASANFGDGVELSGTLGTDPWDRLRFEVDLEGDGLEVQGQLAYNEDHVFRLHEGTARLGDVGVLVANAIVEVHGTRDGQVVIGPDREFSDVRVWGAVATVPCNQLTVHWRPLPDTDGILQAAGFEGDLPERIVPAGKGVPLKATPGGPRLAKIKADKEYPTHVHLVEERDGHARITYTEWTGVVWSGWVPAKKLEVPEPSDNANVFGIGGLGMRVEHQVRRCEHQLPLYAQVGARTDRVGTVYAGTPIEVGDRHGEHVAATFPSGWLYPVDGSLLLVPESATECAQGTWKWEPTEGAIGALQESAQEDPAVE